MGSIFLTLISTYWPATRGFNRSVTYWGMTYSVDGKYLYFVFSPGLPFVITVDASSHSVVGIAPATGTDLPVFV